MKNALLSILFTCSALAGCGGAPLPRDSDAGPLPMGDAGPTPMVDSGSGYTWPTCSGRHVSHLRVVVTPSIATAAGNFGACDSGWRPAALSPAGGPNVEGTPNELQWDVPAAATGAIRLGFRCGTSTTPEVWVRGLAAGRTATSLGVTVYETLEGTSSPADMSAQVTTVPGGGENQLQAPLQETCTRP